ncbi:MAG: hypothetical protein C0624_11725 [Desulfuromonas sp.]|nr:MAG: hypothetical protein C0624_11725 [Desulfuromonas sp.]
MKRFRFTLLAIFLLPLCLGIIDLRVVLDNPEPKTLSAAELMLNGLPQEWVIIEGATLDLTQAINLSGELPIEVLSVPLVGPEDANYKVWIETRNPQLVKLVSHYETGFDTIFAKEAFFEENRTRFFPQRTIRAMAADWISANPNKQNLLKLLPAEELANKDPEVLKSTMILVSEGKEPSPVRGSFYLVSGLLGLVLVIRRWRKNAQQGKSIE